MTNTQEKIIQKPVTRKEFLVYLSLTLASVLGIKNFVSLFTGSSRWNDKLAESMKDSPSGFGSSKFGV